MVKEILPKCRQINEVKDMMPQNPERLDAMDEPKRQEFAKTTYDVVACLHEVYKELGSILPEHIHQEAVAILSRI